MGRRGAVRPQRSRALGQHHARGDEIIEVATADESTSAVLSVAGGGLALETSSVAVATLIPSKAFGAGAFGPLKFRAITKGLTSDWQPLATLVRVPTLQKLDCPSTPELACKLTGTDLYLIESVSGDANFTNPIQVPEGFLGTALPVPHPSGSALYVRLRDDPLIANPATLLVQSAGETDRSAVRQSALHADAPAP